MESGELDLTVTHPTTSGKPTFAFVSNQARTTILFRGSLIRRLHNEGHRVVVLVPDLDDASAAEIRELGASSARIDLSRTGIGPFAWIRSAASVAGQLREHRVDIVFAFFLKPVVVAGIATRFLRRTSLFAMIEGLGFILGNQDVSSAVQRLRRRLAHFLLRHSLGEAKAVLFLNEDDLSYFRKHNICSASQATITGPIGVDLQHYQPAKRRSGGVTFVMVARLLREKGVREYLEAARRVRAELPLARFLLVGDLDQNPGRLSREELASLLADNAVTWLGYVGDVRSVLSEAHLFVLPSYREGYPRSTQEAMAMGLAVITTNVPGCRETVVNGENGILVQPRDVTSLASAMLELGSNPELVSSMGRTSRSIAVQQFDSNIADARIIASMGIAAGLK